MREIYVPARNQIAIARFGRLNLPKLVVSDNRLAVHIDRSYQTGSNTPGSNSNALKDECDCSRQWCDCRIAFQQCSRERRCVSAEIESPTSGQSIVFSITDNEQQDSISSDQVDVAQSIERADR